MTENDLPHWAVEQFEAEVRRLDPQVNGRALKAGVVLLAALQEGTRPERLIAFTAYPRKTVSDFVTRLRKNGVFTDDGHIRANWFGADGGIGFWMDVNVALGFMQRGPRPPADAVREDSR